MSNRISAAAMVHTERELGPEYAAVIFNPATIPDLREFAKKKLEEQRNCELSVTFSFHILSENPAVLMSGHEVLSFAETLPGTPCDEVWGTYLTQHPHLVPEDIQIEERFLICEAWDGGEDSITILFWENGGLIVDGGYLEEDDWAGGAIVRVHHKT